jgi:hypothetical protein
MGGVAHLLVTPAHMLSWIFVVTIMIGLPGLALKYARCGRVQRHTIKYI